MQRQTIIIGLTLLIGGIGEYLFWPGPFFVDAISNELALLIVGAF